jgi:cation diffusion facilitator CzcD-associated flavoprotein CzcO
MPGGTPHNQVAIVGSGFGGLATAVRLEQAGVEDFVVIDRAEEVGGVWRDNDYPGAAVDVRSNQYSLSFAPNPDWHNAFARQPELHAYLRGLVSRFGLRSRLLLGCEVREMSWLEREQHWELETSDGPRTAQHVVIATGPLADPSIPSFPGLDRFKGVKFHSARWDHTFDLAGKRVAVFGTGASAIQFVPAIQPLVAQMTVFQRTPPWIMPRHDREIPAWKRRLFAALPIAQQVGRCASYVRSEVMGVAFRRPSLMRLAEHRARRHLREQVPDAHLRAKLTPGYRLGCKRILLSDDYLPSLTRPNVAVVTSGVDDVRDHSIVDGDGFEHPTDAIVFGTGFQTRALPLTDRIYDAAGCSMADRWVTAPGAYLGTTVAGYPNCYLMHGPNIGTGHTSVLHMYESQVRYLTSAITYASRHGLASVQPTPAAQADYAKEMQRMSDGTVWTAGGCQSWYLDESGRNVNIWPGSTLDYRRRTRRFDPAAHVMERAVPGAVAVAV